MILQLIFEIVGSPFFIAGIYFISGWQWRTAFLKKRWIEKEIEIPYVSVRQLIAAKAYADFHGYDLSLSEIGELLRVVVNVAENETDALKKYC